MSAGTPVKNTRTELDHAFADSNYRIRITKNKLEFLMVLSALSSQCNFNLTSVQSNLAKGRIAAAYSNTA